MGKQRRYTTEGTETDNITEYTYESTFDGNMTTMATKRKEPDVKKGKNELKLLESMGFDKDLAFAALIQSNYHVPKAISYLILNEQRTTNGKKTRVTKK